MKGAESSLKIIQKPIQPNYNRISVDPKKNHEEKKISRTKIRCGDIIKSLCLDNRRVGLSLCRMTPPRQEQESICPFRTSKRLLLILQRTA